VSEQTDMLKHLCQQYLDAIEDYENDRMTVPITVGQSVEQLGAYLESLKVT